MLTKCINVKLNTLNLWYKSGLERHIDILHKRALAFIRCILKSGKFLYTPITMLIISNIYRLQCTNSVLLGKMAASKNK